VGVASAVRIKTKNKNSEIVRTLSPTRKISTEFPGTREKDEKCGRGQKELSNEGSVEKNNTNYCVEDGKEYLYLERVGYVLSAIGPPLFGVLIGGRERQS